MRLIPYEINRNLPLFVQDFNEGWSESPNVFCFFYYYYFAHNMMLRYLWLQFWVTLEFIRRHAKHQIKHFDLASNTSQMVRLANFNINNWKYLVFWKKSISKQVLHFKVFQYIKLKWMKLGSKYDLLDTPAIWNTKKFTEVNITKLLKNLMEVLGAVDFTNCAVSNHYFLGAVG